jgi:hypothetical protein
MEREREGIFVCLFFSLLPFLTLFLVGCYEVTIVVVVIVMVTVVTFCLVVGV